MLLRGRVAVRSFVQFVCVVAIAGDYPCAASVGAGALSSSSRALWFRAKYGNSNEGLGPGAAGSWSNGAGIQRRGYAGGAASALRLRGGAFWFSAVAGLPEKETFFRQISSAPAQWIRERLQKLCPYGTKEASTATKELSAQSGRLRGGGLRQSLPESAEPPAHTEKEGEFAQAGDLVAVTGASGFLAGHVIQQLLAKGFRVRGTVRSLDDEAKVQHLREQFPGIELREANLLDDGVFTDIFRGCKFVIHTASPFTFQVSALAVRI